MSDATEDAPMSMDEARRHNDDRAVAALCHRIGFANVIESATRQSETAMASAGWPKPTTAVPAEKPAAATVGPAIAWTATLGLIPGYGHDNDDAAVAERRILLVEAWSREMERTLLEDNFSVSCVMTDSVVHYPASGRCPKGGEIAVTLSGSSNPRYVPSDRFEAFMDAVESTVKAVQTAMEQTSCRIEFTPLLRSTYSRLDD
jgi:hypothetical protein